MSPSRLSIKVLLSICPPICARLGGLPLCGRTMSILACSPRGLPLTPTTNTRVAPRCKAGLIGADWRTAPSPKYSRLIFTGGKSSGIEALASRCSSDRRVGTPTRR
ncbi:hypothetical protein FQZ97_910790 [compost metagenome]